MKKTAILIGSILICLLFLGLGFFLGRFSYVGMEVIENSKEESLFDKQSKCSALYSIYKDKLSYANSKFSSLSDLSVSYSPILDNCIASWIVSTDLGDKFTYDFNIVNATRGDQSIYKCHGDPLKDEKCNIKEWRSKIYDLTYSDIIEKYSE